MEPASKAEAKMVKIVFFIVKSPACFVERATATSIAFACRRRCLEYRSREPCRYPVRLHEVARSFGQASRSRAISQIFFQSEDFFPLCWRQRASAFRPKRSEEGYQ